MDPVVVGEVHRRAVADRHAATGAEVAWHPFAVLEVPAHFFFSGEEYRCCGEQDAAIFANTA
jgi:hypothetical protein